MSTHTRSIKHDGQDLQESVATNEQQVYDVLLWPHDPKSGQPYSVAALLADDTLPLPESKLAQIIRLRRDHAADDSLPPETMTLAEIREREAAKPQDVFFLSSPSSAHIIKISGGLALAHEIALIHPACYLETQSGQPQVSTVLLSPQDVLAVISLLAQAKEVVDS